MLKKIILISAAIAILSYLGVIKINETKAKEVANRVTSAVKKYVDTDQIKEDVKEYVQTSNN